jgi:hypothetical protein
MASANCVPGIALERPHQGDDPPHSGPAEEKIQNEDRDCVSPIARQREDRGKKYTANPKPKKGKKNNAKRCMAIASC